MIYTIAAICWQYAVPVEVLAKITENGDGGPIGAIARVYLPPTLSWIAIFVVISSAMAGLQVSMTAGARTAYRMAQEGHLPGVFGSTNRYRAPWVSVVVIAAIAIAFVWYKPLSDVTFYYNTVVVTLALAYMSALAAFIRLMFARHSFARAAAASVLPLLAIAVLGYLMYSAGAEPAEPKDKYQAWYIGVGVLISGMLIVMFGKASKRSAEPGLQALMRMTSWGQADITMTQSMSARKMTLSPGFDTVSRHSRSPVASTGMFIHRLKDAGQTGTERSSISRALWRLSAQL